MREWGRILARSMIAIVVLAGAYLAVAWWTGRAVPAALVVEGVSVGGMTTEQATERLQAEFAAKVKAPIRVDLAGTNSSFSLEPATAASAGPRRPESTVRGPDGAGREGAVGAC